MFYTNLANQTVKTYVAVCKQENEKKNQGTSTAVQDKIEAEKG